MTLIRIAFLQRPCMLTWAVRAVLALSWSSLGKQALRVERVQIAQKLLNALHHRVDFVYRVERVSCSTSIITSMQALRWARFACNLHPDPLCSSWPSFHTRLWPETLNWNIHHLHACSWNTQSTEEGRGGVSGSGSSAAFLFLPPLGLVSHDVSCPCRLPAQGRVVNHTAEEQPTSFLLSTSKMHGSSKHLWPFSCCASLEQVPMTLLEEAAVAAGPHTRVHGPSPQSHPGCQRR